MQIAIVNKELCHASTSTLKLTSYIIKEMMTNRQHKSSLYQQYQQYKLHQQKYHNYSRNKMLRYQFRIVMMSNRLQMRLLLSPNLFFSYLLLVLMFFVTPPICQAIGYSYTRFSGPVTGPEQKIFVNDEVDGVGSVAGGAAAGGGGPRVDYIAKPAYEFAYGVEDAQARLLQNRQESRDGDAVSGSYSVVDPDGNLRVVKYTADHVNGFKADVTTNGLNTVVHGHNIPSQGAAPPSWYYPQTVQHQVQHPPQQTHENYAQHNADHGDNQIQGNYEVNEDYEEDDSEKENPKKQEKYKEADDEYEENYDDEDEHEDYDGNEQSAEASNEVTSYEEHSEEYY